MCRAVSVMRIGRSMAMLAVIAVAAAATPAAAAETEPPKPEKFSLWSGHAPVGDGTFETENATITLHRPAPEKAHKVPAEYLELPSGGHGLDHYKGPMWEAWQTKSLEWLAAQKMIPQTCEITP